MPEFRNLLLLAGGAALLVLALKLIGFSIAVQFGLSIGSV